jgi:hypothetical protein
VDPVANPVTTAGVVALESPVVFSDNINSDGKGNAGEEVRYGVTVANGTPFALSGMTLRQLTDEAELPGSSGVDVCTLEARPPAGNERWSNDLAMKSILAEHALEDEAGTRGLVTGPHRTLVGQPTKQPADLHEIGRKRNDLRLVTGPPENGSGDRPHMDIKTNNRLLYHGWTPFPEN